MSWHLFSISALIEKRQVMMLETVQLVCHSLIFVLSIIQENYLLRVHFSNPSYPGLQAEGNLTCLEEKTNKSSTVHQNWMFVETRQRILNYCWIGYFRVFKFYNEYHTFIGEIITTAMLQKSCQNEKLIDKNSEQKFQLRNLTVNRKASKHIENTAKR